MTEQEFRNYLASGIVCNTLWPGKNEINPPVLAAQQTWYKGTTDKATITSIKMVNYYTPTGNETESWAADENGTGSIMCYVNETELTIAGNGSGKIRGNPDSYSLFFGFSSATSIVLDIFDTSNVTTMDSMFSMCKKLTSLDLSSFDTSNMTTMHSMFYMCLALISIDLSSFDTSNVTTMYNMFNWCQSLASIDLSNFDTSNVTDMTTMFENCRSLTSLDLTSFDTSKVKSTFRMFQLCSKLKNIFVSDVWIINEDCYNTYMFDDCATDHVTYV